MKTSEYSCINNVQNGGIMFLESILYLIGKVVFFTGAIMPGSSFPRPLSKEEESKLLTDMKKGDKEARDKLIKHNMRLVAHVVKKYSGSADPDDLISVGSIGLIKAIDSFEEGKGTQLATYTARCIENEILMLFRANKKYKNDVLLSDPVGSDKDGNELTLMDLLMEKEDEVFSKVEADIESEKLLKFIEKVLTKREFTVITLRFGLKGGRCYAQREVASFLKISRSYISRIEKKALDKLKQAIKKEQFYS